MHLSKIYLYTLSFFYALLWLAACSPSSSQANIQKKPITDISRIDSNPMLNPAIIFQTKSTTSVHDILNNDEMAQLQNGDILLRRGYGMVSDFIANYLEEIYPVTHCGFVVRKEDSSIWILHTISSDSHDGMLLEPLSLYIKNSQKNTLVAVRIKTTDEKRKIVLDHAYELLARKVTFDMGFNDADSTQLYCAEMMRNIFKKVYRKDMLSDRAESLGISVIRMSNFFNKKYFETLFNHCETTEK